MDLNHREFRTTTACKAHTSQYGTISWRIRAGSVFFGTEPMAGTLKTWGNAETEVNE
jgi:hypothetical protein